MEGERIFKFSPPSGLVVVLDTHGIDACRIDSINPEGTESTCRMVKVHNGLVGVLSELRILDLPITVGVAVLGNKRRVASAEANRAGAISLAVGNTNPT